jgi:microsomal epoxide hydrolase
MRSIRLTAGVIVVAAAFLVPNRAGLSAQGTSDAIVPFTIAVPDAVLAELKDRLTRTRFPDEIEGSGWEYGTNLSYLRELVTYWRTQFAWRAQERRCLRSLLASGSRRITTSFNTP